MIPTEQESLDEMIARHEPPAEVQEKIEQRFFESAQVATQPNGRKPRSDKGIPKRPRPAPLQGELFNIDAVEGREFLIGTVRYWVSIHASQQIEAVIAWLFKELDRRAAKD